MFGSATHADRHQDAQDSANLHDGRFVEAIAEAIRDVDTRQLVRNRRRPPVGQNAGPGVAHVLDERVELLHAQRDPVALDAVRHDLSLHP